MSSPPDWFRRLVLGEKKAEQPVTRHVFPEFDVHKFTCTSVPSGKRVVQNGYEFVVTDDGVWYMVKEPSMAEAGVKVEVVEPQPKEYVLRVVNKLTGLRVSESEARALWEGLGEHFFNPYHITYTGSAKALLDAKDAEIAGLKKANDQWKLQHDQLAETCQRQGNRISELKDSRGWKAINQDLNDEIDRLRGWLEKIKEIEKLRNWDVLPTYKAAVKALAGEKVPD